MLQGEVVFRMSFQFIFRGCFFLGGGLNKLLACPAQGAPLGIVLWTLKHIPLRTIMCKTNIALTVSLFIAAASLLYLLWQIRIYTYLLSFLRPAGHMKLH